MAIKFLRDQNCTDIYHCPRESIGKLRGKITRTCRWETWTKGRNKKKKGENANEYKSMYKEQRQRHYSSFTENTIDLFYFRKSRTLT